MSKTAWQLGDLRRHIRTLPPERRQAPLEIVSSIDRSNSIFNYHFFTARDALKGLIDESNASNIENVKVIFDGMSGKNGDVGFAYVVSEAHILGCIHALRGMLDIFSHLMNELLLDPKLQLKRCDIYKAHAALPQSELRDLLGQLMQSPWFQYIAAFINTAKHRHLVGHSFSVFFEEDRVGVRMGRFEYEGTCYLSCWGRELLNGAVDVKNDLIACGRSLNSLIVT